MDRKIDNNFLSKSDNQIPLLNQDDHVNNEQLEKQSFKTKIKNFFGVNKDKATDEYVNNFPALASRRESVFTLEKPPKVDFYKNSNRPTISQLLGSFEEFDSDEPVGDFEKRNIKIIDLQLKKPKKSDSSDEIENRKKIIDDELVNKFGWFVGVFIRCTANIFGAILYLRMSWVLGHSGIILGSLMVLLSCLVTIIASLSMSAICTNGEIKGGGAYFMVSRTLGPELGGSIGIIFCLANNVGAAMYVVGFGETINDLLKDYGIVLIDGGINDIRLISLITIVILEIIIFISLAFESKLQVIMLFIVFLTIIDYLMGSFFSPTEQQAIRGMTGYSLKTFQENLFPAFRQGYSFFTVFSVFFPAATGIMAGANISSTLKNPSTAIPKGTLLAICTTTVVYLTMLTTMGASVVRDADGINPPILLNQSTSVVSNGWFIDTSLRKFFGPGTQNYLKPQCFYKDECPFGSTNHFQVFRLMSYFPAFVIFGIFASTLSSALLSLVSAPLIFQAICRDNIFPYINYFGKGYGKTDEPKRAYFLTFIIACCMIMIGDLNNIAPIITNFFLCTYVLLNYACFDLSINKSPGFRPTFKFFNHWICLFGSVLCILIMFIISWFNALLTFLLFGIVYVFLKNRKPDVNWGSSLQANNYRRALQSVQKLENTNEHVKNYRPQILVLTGNPASRPGLVDFANAITKGKSLLSCGHVLPFTLNKSINDLIKTLNENGKTWFKNRHVKSFYITIPNPDFRLGVQNLIYSSGLTRLKPNILLLGYKQEWYNYVKENSKEIDNYFNILKDAFTLELGVGILRNENNSLDMSNIINLIDELSNDNKSTKLLNYKNKNHNDNLIKNSEIDSKSIVNDLNSLSNSVNKFQMKIKKGIIDVWWLYDDGGLSLLIPYLLTQEKSYLEGAKLRVFTISKTLHKIDEEKKLILLLNKFRINFSQVTVIPDKTIKPNEKYLNEFEEIISPFYTESVNNENEGLITKSELLLHEEKTWRYLRMSEYLRSYSSQSDLIVITLPFPRKNINSSYLYMAWLEMMSKNLPPTLFIRGNQQNVLTFYN